jgi:RimJ/RimL family protein N-acetyltransferase
VLEAVAAIGHPALEVDVVIGAQHPARGRIERLAAGNPRLHCHVQTDRVAQLCAAADLAVGAGGGATWERCALGLPALGLCLAENQLPVLQAGARHGFIYVPNDFLHDAPTIALHLRALLNNNLLREHMSRIAMDLVDAQGLQRVTAFLLQQSVTIRIASAADSRMLHTWRNAPEVRQASRNAEEIPWEAHQRWLENVLADAARHLLIGERGGEPVGVVRFDPTPDGTGAEISIYLAPGRQGRGDGTALLRAAQDWLTQKRPGTSLLHAEVLHDNQASHRLFGKAGFSRQATRYAKRI